MERIDLLNAKIDRCCGMKPEDVNKRESWRHKDVSPSSPGKLFSSGRSRGRWNRK
jgi:hypothetical protein